MFSQVRSSAVFWPGRLWSTACRAVWVFHFGPFALKTKYLQKALQAPSLSNNFFFSVEVAVAAISFFLFFSFSTRCKLLPEFLWLNSPGLNMATSLWHCHFEYITTTSLLGNSVPCITLFRVSRSTPLKGKTPFFRGELFLSVSYRLVWIVWVSVSVVWQFVHSVTHLLTFSQGPFIYLLYTIR